MTTLRRNTPSQSPETDVAKEVRISREAAQARMAEKSRGTKVPVTHEGGPIKITVRTRRILGATGLLVLATGVAIGAHNLLSNDEKEAYTGPVHVVTADDGSRTVEGVYDVKKGDTLWDVAAQVNELGGVTAGDAESQLLKTQDYLILTGGGMGEDGSTIPIQNASQLSPGQDILVYNFKVSPEGESQLSLSN